MESDGPMKYEGYLIDLLHATQDIIGFNYTLTVGPLNSYGILLKNGTWHGLTQKLIDGEAEMGLVLQWMTSFHSPYLDFSYPFYDNAGLKILMKKPVKPIAFFKFLTVFETNVWLTILALYFLTSFTIYFYECKSPYSFRNNRAAYVHDDLEKERIFSIKECLWFGVMCLMPQGGGAIPRSKTNPN